MKYTSKFILNWEEYEFAAPSGWRQPWANTVAYYPLTEDFNDYSWNSYNLTQNSAQITTLDWVKCCDLNSSYCSAGFSINTLPCTMVFWAKANSISNMFLSVVFNDSTQHRWWWGIMTRNVDELIVRYWNPTDQSSPISHTFDTNWNLYAITLDSSGGVLYVNGNSYQLKTNLSNPSWSGSPLRIWANEVWQTWWWNWYISNLILEDKAWTAQEVSDYFNQTKSLYGIS